MASSSTTDIPTSTIETPELHRDEKSSSEQFRKLFIGGLIYTTTDENLK